jgi:hypothetical protein
MMSRRALVVTTASVSIVIGLGIALFVRMLIPPYVPLTVTHMSGNPIKIKVQFKEPNFYEPIASHDFGAANGGEVYSEVIVTLADKSYVLPLNVNELKTMKETTVEVPEAQSGKDAVVLALVVLSDRYSPGYELTAGRFKDKLP